MSVYVAMVEVEVSEYHDFRGEPLPEDRIPTILNVANYLIHLSEKNNVSKNKCVDVVAKAVISIWKKASIPIVSKSTVKRRVQDVLTKSNNLIKCNVIVPIIAGKKPGRMRKKKYVEEKEVWKTAFDICDRNNYDAMSESVKVFLDDQMSARTMTIEEHADADAEPSTHIDLHQSNAEEHDTSTIAIENDSASSSRPFGTDNHEISDPQVNVPDSDSDYRPESHEEDENDTDSDLSQDGDPKARNRLNMKSLGILSDRFGFSSRSSAGYGSEC